MILAERNVLVTGGCSFIGAPLVDELVGMGCNVTVVDDLSSGKLSNLDHLRGNFNMITGNLLEQSTMRHALRGQNVVFHLAADHGGRGYVATQQVACGRNLYLDGMLFSEADSMGVEKIVFASSGCVYPNHMQNDPRTELYLTEDQVGPPYDADNMYGWAKLMSELQLRHLHTEHDISTVSLRYFTVFGPRGKEDHAIIAMIARAFIHQDPFQIWGTGEQVRNWTYVDDIVAGTIAAAERIHDGSAINLGTMERNTVNDALTIACELAEYEPEVKRLLDMPVGPRNRVADNALARELLDWEPKVKLREGMQKTWDWYRSTHTRSDVKDHLEERLMTR